MEVNICEECGEICTPIKIDFGIGPYEYWGFKGIDKNVQVVSNCCETSFYSIEEDEYKEKKIIGLFDLIKEKLSKIQKIGFNTFLFIETIEIALEEGEPYNEILDYSYNVFSIIFTISDSKEIKDICLSLKIIIKEGLSIVSSI